MKRIIAVVVSVALAFYGIWPGWNAYQISAAIKARDHATLEQKIAFPEVRETLRPLTLQKVSEVYDQQLKGKAGPTGAAILDQIKGDVVPKIVDTALLRLVTAPNLVRLVNDGRPLKESAERILRDEVGKIGTPGTGGAVLSGRLGQLAEKVGIPGLSGPREAAPESDAQPVQVEPVAEPPEKRSFTLSNVKRFGFLGPLAFEVGLAKDPAATQPDVLVEVRFVGGDWRVVGVKPQV